jgi:hypothetical protein
MAPSPDPALDAFREVPPHLADAQGRWCAWLTEPAGVYDVIAPGHHVHDEFATFLTGDAVALADRVFGSRAHVRYVHDWRRASTYSVSVRARLVNWGLSEYGRERVERITVIVDDQTPMLLRMACNAATSLMAAGGVRMSVLTPSELGWEKSLRPITAERLGR